MSKLIYWLFHTRCKKFKPQKLLEHLQKRITQENLVDVISHVRIEKGIKKKGEYYFYLGIDPKARPDWESRQKDNLEKFLKTISGINKAARQEFYWEEIRHMVGIAYDLEQDIQTIRYFEVKRLPKVNPFRLETPIAESAESDRSRACEQLLWWLSAAGSGSWETFQAVCDRLDLPQPRRLLRRLQLLGHLTVARDGRRWQMQPPSLQPVGENCYVLYGQRNAALQKDLQQLGRLKEIPQSRKDAPPCWQFELQTDVATAIAKLRASYPTLGIRPVEAPPQWDNWVATLDVVDWVPLHRYRLKRYDGSHFADVPTAEETGFYELHEKGSPQQHALFYDREQDRWYSGEWYGLRFLALTRLASENLSVKYDPNSRELSIPISQRWPLAYKRYLVMQSGCLPCYRPETEELVYQNITPTAWQIIGERLPLLDLEK
ncbi:hypothetical protein [Synechococcus sp. H55.11]|uniref:hypothetical protein n=1 Tax=Synechococcus sp. H55.11 TaxID=2967121 RepID=UPI0039C33AB6